MQITSEGPVKITKTKIEAAWKERGKDRRHIVRDKERRGLALIVNETTMRWEYSYRPRGIDPRSNKRWPNQTVTLGDPSEVSPDDARDQANKVRGRVREGGDPASERRAAIKAEERKRSLICDQLVDAYEAALPRRPKMRGDGTPSAAYVAVEVEQTRKALTAIDAIQIPVTELTPTDVRRLLSGAAGKGGNAKARYGALTRFLDWCLDEELIAANPCAQIARNRRPRAPAARKGYLTPEQLATIWKGAATLRKPVWRDIARFLIAIPCRRGEAAELDWSHLDLDAAEWRQPGSLTKNGDAHRLHLHPLALDILRTRWVDAGTPRDGLVFPGPRAGAVILNWGDIKSELDHAAGVSDWIFHDFRRSFATALGEAGVSETIADAILNHRQSATRGGVLGVYQMASRWPEQVKAMQLWGEMLTAAIEGRRPNVTDLEAARAARLA
jgi:integrase